MAQEVAGSRPVTHPRSKFKVQSANFKVSRKFELTLDFPLRTLKLEPLIPAASLQLAIMDGGGIHPVCRIDRWCIGSRESPTHRPGLTLGQRRLISLAGNRFGDDRGGTSGLRRATGRQLQSAACRQRVGAGRTNHRTLCGFPHRLVIPSAIAGRRTTLIATRFVGHEYATFIRRARGRADLKVGPTCSAHDYMFGPRPSGRPTVRQRF